MRPSLFNLDYQELKDQIQDWNEPSYRATQIWQGLYQNYWNNSDDFSTIPIPLRKEIDKEFTRQMALHGKLFIDLGTTLRLKLCSWCMRIETLYVFPVKLDAVWVVIFVRPEIWD